MSAITGKQQIALQSAHGKYLVAEMDGTLNANRDGVGAWEQFTILKANNLDDGGPIRFGERVALRSFHGKYVVAEADGRANADRDGVGAWEQWQMINPAAPNSTAEIQASGKVAFKGAHGRYLVAEADGKTNANRDAVGAWETWVALLPDQAQKPQPPDETGQPAGPVEDDDSARPAQTIAGSGATVRAWNNYGGLVETLAKDNGIETATVLAILAIESGGAGFVGGRLKIRFENHLFRRRMEKADRLADYDAHFKGVKWTDVHQFFKDGEWQNVHKGQDNEWAALTLAQSLDKELATESISMGAPQIMGFHGKRLGYGSAVGMLEAFQKSGAEHIRAMFNFLKTAGLVEAMRNNDFAKVAEVYNGAGNVSTYSTLMKQAYEVAKPKLDEIGVT